MRTHRLLAFVPAFSLFGILALSGLAAAEDPAPAVPKLLPPAKSAFLESMLGSWDVTVKGGMGDMKGVDVWSKAVDGTAYVHELHVVESDKSSFDGLGVFRVAEDGKTMTAYWFDSMGGGAMETRKGTVGDDGYELTGEEAGMKSAETFKKVEGGFKFSMTMDGNEVASGTWKKSAGATLPEPKGGKLADVPFVKAYLGDWVVTGSSGEVKLEGTSRMRLAVGGHYLVDDYLLVGGAERHIALGIYSLGDDGKTVRTWWFGNYFSAPMALTGPVTDKGWTLKGAHPAGGELTLVMSQTEKGLKGVYTAGGPEIMTVEYAKK